MKKRIKLAIAVSVAILAIFILAGCVTEPPKPVSTPEATAPQEPTDPPKATEQPEPTDEPEPSPKPIQDGNILFFEEAQKDELWGDWYADLFGGMIINNTESVVKSLAAYSSENGQKAERIFKLIAQGVNERDSAAEAVSLLNTLKDNSDQEELKKTAEQLASGIEAYKPEEAPAENQRYYKLFAQAEVSDGGFSEMVAAKLYSAFAEDAEELVRELAAFQAKDSKVIIDKLVYGADYHDMGEFKTQVAGLKEALTDEAQQAIIDGILDAAK